MANKNIDLLKHILVPEHKILSAEEKQELLLKYNISEIQLPSIKKNDVIVKQIEAKQGDIIKIIRTDKTELNTPYYRRVI